MEIRYITPDEAADYQRVSAASFIWKFNEEEDSFEVLTAPDDFDAVHKALEEANIPMAQAEVSMIPQTYVTLTDETDLKNINKILDLLDAEDDVQEVFHNFVTEE